MPNLLDSIYLSPKQAIEQVAGKTSRITWDWRELIGNEHNRAFTVAKMTRVDLLKDIKAILKDSIKQGLTGVETRKVLESRMRAAGWWGRREQLNPKTGLTESVNLGTPWRIDTIVRTNTQSAFMAGKWRRFYDNKADRPYLEYVAIRDGSTRKTHRELNGFIAKINDPVWSRIFPPNGYNCRCRVRALTEKQARARGEDVKIPSGFPDPGFSGNPGRFSDVDSVRLFHDKASRAKDMKAFRDFTKDPYRLNFLQDIGIPGIATTGSAYLLNILGPQGETRDLIVNKTIKPDQVGALLAATTGAVNAYVDSKTGKIFIPKPGTKKTYYIFSKKGIFIKSGIVLFFGKRYQKI